MPQELFGAAGVEMTVQFLRKGYDKFHSGLGHNKLILTTVDCVWSVPPSDPLFFLTFKQFKGDGLSYLF